MTEQLCTHTPPQIVDDRDTQKETLETTVEIARELSLATEKDGTKVYEALESEAINELKALVRLKTVLEDEGGEKILTDLSSQEAENLKMLLELSRHYDVHAVMRGTSRLMIDAYEGRWSEQEKRQNISLLKKHHRALCEYFDKTKKIGLGLPDRAAMRIGHHLYSLEVVLKNLDK